MNGKGKLGKTRKGWGSFVRPSRVWGGGFAISPAPSPVNSQLSLSFIPFFSNEAAEQPEGRWMSQRQRPPHLPAEHLTIFGNI